MEVRRQLLQIHFCQILDRSSNNLCDEDNAVSYFTSEENSPIMLAWDRKQACSRWLMAEVRDMAVL